MAVSPNPEYKVSIPMKDGGTYLIKESDMPNFQELQLLLRVQRPKLKVFNEIA